MGIKNFPWTALMIRGTKPNRSHDKCALVQDGTMIKETMPCTNGVGGVGMLMGSRHPEHNVYVHAHLPKAIKRELVWDRAANSNVFC